MKKEIKLSPGFKKQTTKAIVSVLFFAMVYMAILLFGIALTILCVLGGVLLILSIPRFITIVLGIGLASLGILILIFLLKFMFKSHQVDRSHLSEITKLDQPDLFRFIQEIVEEVGTAFPKKVYLSSDVNAGVFYDSSFWSMFLPVKKNLQIGMGLINTVTQSELKAILAHEFGHFSQRTMKVGSYVYNVNQIIFNMLYDNDSYDKIIQGWASVSGYFSIFVIIAVKIIQAIQWILRKMYDVVNKNYLGLSREMEFHADEIAASVTGVEPLKKSLLRMPLSDNSFNSVLNFYSKKIEENAKSKNLYEDHSFVLNFTAEVNHIPVMNHFPHVTLEDVNKYDKSKLVIADQWASHPTTEERIKRLESLGLHAMPVTSLPAKQLFCNIQNLQEELSEKLFAQIDYQQEPVFISSGEFQNEYKKEYVNDSFPELYNSYYDNKNPLCFDVHTVAPTDAKTSITDLFSDSMVDLVYTEISLKNDIKTLEQIGTKEIPVKYFDYDGKKYKRKQSKQLLTQLHGEVEEIEKKIKENDIAIYAFFLGQETKRNNEKRLAAMYDDFFSFDKEYDRMYAMYGELILSLQFINVSTPFKQIEKNFRYVESLEKNFKDEIADMLIEDKYQSVMTEDIKETFETYISQSWTYFKNESYFNDNLQKLFNSLDYYAYLLSRRYFLLKKDLLNYQQHLLINRCEKMIEM